MQIVALPVPTFVDSSGQPLEAGSVYIGTINQNPETSPIAVYWDAALTQPAAQPIRTSGGMAMRNGTPSNLYAASAYSMTVRNKNGALVYTFPDSSSTTPASSLSDSSNLANGDALVAVKQPFTGAVATTVHEWISRRVDVKDFGAKGDGSTDDTAAIQAAINYVSTGAGIVDFPAGVYKITSTLTISSPGVMLRGQGGGIDGNVQFLGPWTQVVAQAATRIVWGGAATANPMLLISPVDVPSPLSYALEGGGIAGIMFDANSLADIGVKIISTRASRYIDMSIVRHKAYGLILGTTVNNLNGGNVSLSLCEFNNVSVSTANLPGNTAKAMLVYGTGMLGNVCQCTFTNCQWFCNDFNATSVDMALSDDNTFVSCRWTGKFVQHSGDSGPMPTTTGFPGSLAQNNFFFSPLGDFTFKKNVEAIGTAWASGQTVAIGDVRWLNYIKYTAATAGVTGATPPTHITGTVSDGGVSWTYTKFVKPTFGHGVYSHSGNLIDGLSLRDKFGVEAGADVSVFGSCVDYQNNRGFVSFGTQPAFTRAFMSSDKTATTGVTTTLSWDGVSHDVLQTWSAGDPTKIYVPNNVKFAEVTFLTKWANSGVGQRYAGIYQNGSPVAEMQFQGSGLTPMQVASGVIPVTPGDYLTGVLQQQSGGNLNYFGVSTLLVVKWY